MATASEASTASQVPSRCTRRPDHAAPPTRGASQRGAWNSCVRSRSAATSASAPAKLKMPYLEGQQGGGSLPGDFGRAAEPSHRAAPSRGERFVLTARRTHSRIRSPRWAGPLRAWAHFGHAAALHSKGEATRGGRGELLERDRVDAWGGRGCRLEVAGSDGRGGRAVACHRRASGCRTAPSPAKRARHARHREVPWQLSWGNVCRPCRYRC